MLTASKQSAFTTEEIQQFGPQTRFSSKVYRSTSLWACDTQGTVSKKAWKKDKRRARKLAGNQAPTTKHQFASRLRRNPSFPEKLLAGKLQPHHANDIKFLNQHVLFGWIADFYCPKAHLVIEVDGKQHLTPRAQAYDKFRDETMRRAGLTVLRIPASKVLKELDAVAAEILAAARQAIEAKASCHNQVQGKPSEVTPEQRSARRYTKPGRGPLPSDRQGGSGHAEKAAVCPAGSKQTDPRTVMMLRDGEARRA